MLSLRIALAAAILPLAGCHENKTDPVPVAPASAAAGTSPAAPKAAHDLATIATTEGDMTFELLDDKAPKTVANFEKLAKDGFYNGTAFHRIIKGFMVQGGDPLTKDPARRAEWGTGGPGYSIKAEFNDTAHVFGVLSMARSGHPDSAGSQFFVVDGDAPHLDGKYTAFGRLIKGADTLSKIAVTSVTYSAAGEPSAPVKRIEIESIVITPAAK